MEQLKRFKSTSAAKSAAAKALKGAGFAIVTRYSSRQARSSATIGHNGITLTETVNHVSLRFWSPSEEALSRARLAMESIGLHFVTHLATRDSLDFKTYADHLTAPPLKVGA